MGLFSGSYSIFCRFSVYLVVITKRRGNTNSSPSFNDLAAWVKVSEACSLVCIGVDDLLPGLLPELLPLQPLFFLPSFPGIKTMKIVMVESISSQCQISMPSGKILKTLRFFWYFQGVTNENIWVNERFIQP